MRANSNLLVIATFMLILGGFGIAIVCIAERSPPASVSARQINGPTAPVIPHDEIGTMDAFDAVDEPISAAELAILQGRAGFEGSVLRLEINDVASWKLSSVLVRVNTWSVNRQSRSKLYRLMAVQTVSGKTIFESVRGVDLGQRWEWQIVEARGKRMPR